jgi:hypothetical protein
LAYDPAAKVFYCKSRQLEYHAPQWRSQRCRSTWRTILFKYWRQQMRFNPCTDNCTKDGTHCQGCGRSHEEIAETKKLVGTVVAFAQKQGYENIEDFANAIGKSVLKKLQQAG